MFVLTLVGSCLVDSSEVRKTPIKLSEYLSILAMVENPAGVAKFGFRRIWFLGFRPKKPAHFKLTASKVCIVGNITSETIFVGVHGVSIITIVDIIQMSDWREKRQAFLKD